MDDVDLGQNENEEAGSEEDDEIDSDYFAANGARNDVVQGLNSSRVSNVSSGSAATFRDTELSEIDALKTMRIQSLTSIVNHPEKKSLM